MPFDLDSPLMTALAMGVAAFLGVLLAYLAGHWFFSQPGTGDGPPADLSLRAATKGANPFHDPFAEGSAAERRRAPRRRGGLIEVQISDASGTAEPVFGRVVDRCVEGLALWVEESVPEGTILSVRPARMREGSWVQVEVRRCRPDDDGYELGCRYVVTPSWGVRMLFG
jgi:hypothetical protein